MTGAGPACVTRMASSTTPDVARLIGENAIAIHEVAARAEAEATVHERAATRLRDVVGSPRGIAVLVGLASLWIAYNVAATRLGWPIADAPPFPWLQGALTLYGATIATVVLAAQNREAALDQRRAELELHVNLIAEQRTAKIVALLEELRRDLPNVPNRPDPAAAAMAQPAHPRVVVEVAEQVALEPPPGPPPKS